MKIPVVIQMQPGENGAAALCMMLGYYKRFVPLEEMREKCVSSRNGSSPEQIIKAAAEYGLDGRVEKLDIEEFADKGYPILVHWKRRYYAIIKAIRGNLVTILDPAKGEYRMTLDKFRSVYKGRAILFEKNSSFAPGGKRDSLFSLIANRLYYLRGPMIALTIFTVICVRLNLSMAEISKEILDHYVKAGHKYTGGGPWEYEGFLVLCIYLLCLLVYTISSILKTRIINKSSRDISAVSGSHLFKKMVAQPMKFFEQYSAGELMSRIDNNIRLDNSIVKSLVPRAIDAVMTLIYIISLVGYNSTIALVCLAIVLIHIALTMMVQERNAIAARSMATSTGVVATSLLNGMNMIDTIKSTGSERAFYNMWHESQTTLNENKITGFNLNSMMSFLSGINRYILQAVQLFMGAYFIIKGNFTLGTMSLFQSVLNSMISSISNCLTTVDTLQRMRTNIERVDDINKRSTREEIPLPKSEYDTVDKLSGQLEASHICFRYNSGDALAVDDVSIRVEPGQMVAIVGATGCGKSTLLKILADLYRPESGQILYAGKPREKIPDVVFHSSITTVDQETMMFEDSIYNNIKMWDTTIENYEVVMAARDAQIHQRICKDRREYSAPMLENGRNFSGGELQRLELARALAHEPTLLFLDEFTSALDALTEDRVIQSIRNKGTTCIIVAHRLSTIVDCDRIYVMDGGKVVQEGTHTELYNQEGLYRELIGSQ